MQVITDNLMTHYERSGTPNGRNTVLILPGWADTSKSWLAVQKLLSRDFDVIILDIPGFGGSQKPAEDWGLEEYVTFIANFLKKIAAPDLLAVIGHSNGGAMAIKAVGGGTIQPQKLVLLASAGIRGTQAGRNFGLKLLAKSGKALTRPLPESMRKKLRANLYSAAGSDMLVAEHMQETFKKVVGTDVRSDARTVTVPTLLIYGSKDMDAPVAYGRTFSELIKQSRLIVLPDTGHFLQLEKPQEITQSIQEFLA
jgi:pimeloyl-ACP methyl ester carboxylesterase